MAASVASAMVGGTELDGTVTVESFGTAGYHVGEPADPRADAALRRRGWPAGGHRARRITAADVEAADLVLCADRSNLLDVRRLAPGQAGKVRLLRSFDPGMPPGEDEVPDPWYGNESHFDSALQVIEASCRGLIDHLAATSS
jgi:protein-tyrosine phosphatase